MENSPTPRAMRKTLGFFEIIKESFKILFKNPTFIFFTFITSLPLFCFLFLQEIILQQILIKTAKFILQQILIKTAKFIQLDTFFIFDNEYLKLLDIGKMLEEISPKFFLLSFMYLGILHCQDLFNTVAIVDIASIIYSGQNSINLKNMFFIHVQETRFKGPLITSICVLSLSLLVSLGLLSFATYVFLTSMSVLFVLLFAVLFVVLLGKYMEWSAIWNVGIAISVLEEKQGDVALLVSSYLTRCNRGSGFFLMFAFFAWRFALRFSCLYEGWSNGGSSLLVTAVHIGLVCMSNVLKWVSILVYFYDCKQQSAYDKVSVAV